MPSGKAIADRLGAEICRVVLRFEREREISRDVLASACLTASLQLKLGGSTFRHTSCWLATVSERLLREALEMPPAEELTCVARKSERHIRCGGGAI